jgi:hypothetical protein
MEQSDRSGAPDDPLAEEEAQAAAAEAGAIGGEAGDEELDPAERPVAEGGGGESEGAELAEEDLIDAASHGGSEDGPSPDQ